MMQIPFRAKKRLGQHFLTDAAIAERIVEQLPPHAEQVVEVGAGTGALTHLLVRQPNIVRFVAVEMDEDAAAHLCSTLTLPSHCTIVQDDILRIDLSTLMTGNYSIIGNFPYNISSQILFRVLDSRNCVDAVVGMFQREVALRIAARAGSSRECGVLSVLLQAYYDVEYLFTVPPSAFVPAPAVQSGVVRLTRNNTATLPCNEVLFQQIVKTAYHQRRKMLRNSLHAMLHNVPPAEPLLSKRPEQLTTAEFVSLTNMIEGK